MMLRFRLGLLLTVTMLFAILAYGVLAVVVFERLQWQGLELLLTRELTRIQALVESSEVGARFVEGRAGAANLQFVSRDGEVQLPTDASVPLPLVDHPTRIEREGRALLVAVAPWRLPSGNTVGTIRLALEVDDTLAAQRTLIVSLLLSGLVIGALALYGSLAVLRRALAPLGALAEQAGRLDPANPTMTAYRGPDDEVARVAKALDRALDGIRARQRSERDALAEVAHELAAPLSVVAGQLEALAGDRNDPRYRAASDAANELLYTSQDLLTLARGELERDFELGVVELGEVARRVAGQYPGVRVEVEAAADEVLGSRERLVQVVRNLVRNAVQATGDPGRVTVRVYPQGSEVRLDVCDDGPGVSSEEQTRIFERYVSGRPGGGVGVGLSVARSIAERHEGSLSLRSSPGRGSVFTLALPSLGVHLDDDEEGVEV